MKDFNELSGPWTGLSVQAGLRISEAIRLHISGGQISGTGTDIDGEFELTGFYNAKKERVMITRRYSWTPEPLQDGVGIPYDYDGVWDGAMVSGIWQQRLNPSNRGTFEMWPSREEDQKELAIALEAIPHVGTSGRAPFDVRSFLIVGNAGRAVPMSDLRSS